jgi:hypothetical protein
MPPRFTSQRVWWRFSSLLPVDAQIVPRPFREVDTIVPCSFLHVRKRQITIFIGDVDDLIEPGDGVTPVLSVGQRFFALFGKCINASWSGHSPS